MAGRSGALPGTGGASVKVTPFAEYPPKGRATGGVRCQRFLKGEDGLILAWIGPAPVLAATESGVMVDLSDMQGRRDGSGTALTRQLAQVGHPFRSPAPPALALAVAAGRRSPPSFPRREAKVPSRRRGGPLLRLAVARPKPRTPQSDDRGAPFGSRGLPSASPNPHPRRNATRPTQPRLTRRRGSAATKP